MTVPHKLETPRLILRAMTESDAPLVQTAIEPALDHLRQWIPWTLAENTLEFNLQRIQEYESDWLQGKSFCYLAIEKETGDIVGMMGLYGVVLKSRYCHIGFWVTPSAEGRGIASEAVNCLFQMGKDVLLLDRIAVMCDDRNQRSAAVARRTGFTLEGVMRKDWLEPDGTLSNTMIFSKVRGIEF
ncbi:acyl-CoA N-acyltransferase [Obelidium mucronatum]|nr:acyl-CoA N-acyltransferase [Obelidium mucronatum]